MKRGLYQVSGDSRILEGPEAVTPSGRHAKIGGEWHPVNRLTLVDELPSTTLRDKAAQLRAAQLQAAG